MSLLLTNARGTFDQCRWIVCDDVGDKADLFAGRRVCGKTVSLPTSYCPEHRLRIYDRAPAVRPFLDAMPTRPAADHEPELTEIFA